MKDLKEAINISIQHFPGLIQARITLKKNLYKFEISGIQHAEPVQYLYPLMSMTIKNLLSPIKKNYNIPKMKIMFGSKELFENYLSSDCGFRDITSDQINAIYLINHEIN